MRSFAKHQVLVATARHGSRLAGKPANARTQGIRRVVPVLLGDLGADQRTGKVPVACPVAESVMGPKQHYSPRDSGIARIVHLAEPAVPVQGQEALHRQHAGVGLFQPIEHEAQPNSRLAAEAA